MRKLMFLLTVCFLASSDLWAQGCVICTNTASNLDQDSAKGLNSGIIYLAALPLLFIGTVGFIWYRRNKSTEE
jgi:hypothetical protein